MLFLRKRRSSVCSATTSFRSRTSRLRSLTSSVVAARAVSPASRRLPSTYTLTHELLGPLLVNAPRHAFPAAHFCNSVFAAQAFKNNPDLLLGRKLPPRPSLDLQPVISVSSSFPSKEMMNHNPSLSNLADLSQGRCRGTVGRSVRSRSHLVSLRRLR